MIKFTKYKDRNNPFDTTDIEMTSHAEDIDAVLKDFSNFLKACGYYLPEKDMPIVLVEDGE